MILKIIYKRKKWFGLVPTFFHSALEVDYNGKTERIGFYEKFGHIWPLSLLIPLPGEIRKETGEGYSFIISKDEKKIKRVLELAKSKKYRWRVYHALFRNCFHWRNLILEEAGIKHPRGDWFFRVS